MNLYLLGFMGTGKTTVGRELAAKLGCPWIDLDHFLEQTAGRSIPDIFRESGEEFFRELEQRCLEEISGLNHHVITTGGGIVVRERNREIMKETGYRITLSASLECIWERIKGDTQRPLIHHPDPLGQIEKLMTQRAGFYAETDLIVDSTNKSVDLIIQEILTSLSAIQCLGIRVDGQDERG